MKNVNEIFSENLKSLIAKSGKNQTQIADDLGISKGTMSDWARGRIVPRMAKVEMLAGYFGVQKSDLLEEKSNDSKYYSEKIIEDVMRRMNKSPRSREMAILYLTLNDEDKEMLGEVIKHLAKLRKELNGNEK